MTKSLSRRDFLKVAGFTLGGVALTCSGLTFLGTRQPKITHVQTSCGSATREKILVAYASKCGSTGEVAEAIAQVLCDRGASVDVKLARDVATLEGYQQVIVGSAIRMGYWLGEAVDFVKRHQQHLQALPTAIFSVHLINLEDTEVAQQAREAYTAPVHQLVTPQAEIFFAGKMDFAHLSFLDRTISKAIGSEEEDLRDWDIIRAWAEQL